MRTHVRIVNVWYMERGHDEGEDEARGTVCAGEFGSADGGEPAGRVARAIEFEGWAEVAVYKDEGISGSKGRRDRPGLDQMLTDAEARRFDVVMAWAIDRLGRSLLDLLGTIKLLEKAKVDLYLREQRIDTTTDEGRLLFSICGALAEFERRIINRRIRAGVDRVKAELDKERQVHGQEVRHCAHQAWSAGCGAGEDRGGPQAPHVRHGHQEGCGAHQAGHVHRPPAGEGDARHGLTRPATFCLGPPDDRHRRRRALLGHQHRHRRTGTASLMRPSARTSPKRKLGVKINRRCGGKEWMAALPLYTAGRAGDTGETQASHAAALERFPHFRAAIEAEFHKRLRSLFK